MRSLCASAIRQHLGIRWAFRVLNSSTSNSATLDAEQARRCAVFS